MEQLAASVTPGSRVFVYFSGHGTRWYDESTRKDGCTEGLLAAETQPFGVSLLDGIVGFIFKGTGGGVQVRTPSAVASVRSTEWAMRWSNGVSEVFTREGTVAVSANGGSVGLGPGDGVDVSGSGEFKPVVQWKPPRIARFGELLGADW
jgi:hypothetical protein